MRRLRKLAFAVVVPLVLGVCIWMPLALATETTSTFKTIGGGFSGGTVLNATTFNSTVTFGTTTTFTGTAAFNGGLTVGTSQIVVIGGGSNLCGGTSGLTDNCLRYETTLTPDTWVMATGSIANSWSIYRRGDFATDFQNGACGTTACVDPSVIIHSGSTSLVDYAQVSAGAFVNKAVKALTESAATSTARVPVAALAGTGGDFDYCVHANDATDIQERCGHIKFSVVNKAATETCVMTSVAGTADASISETEDGSGTGAISAGTLTYAVTCDTSPTNAVDFQINAVSSLTQTTLETRWGVTLNGPGLVARQ